MLEGLRAVVVDALLLAANVTLNAILALANLALSFL